MHLTESQLSERMFSQVFRQILFILVTAPERVSTEQYLPEAYVSASENDLCKCISHAVSHVGLHRSLFASNCTTTTYYRRRTM